MKRGNIIAAAAVATAGIASYLIRKKIRSRKDNSNGHSASSEPARHLTNVFARAKSVTKEL